MLLRAWNSVKRGHGWLSETGGPLKHRALRGSFWLLGADAASRVLGLVKMTILARLLSPHDFGIVGLANVFLSWFEYFTQTGLSAALVQKDGDIQPYMHTFWTVQMLRGCAVFIVLLLTAPFGAAFFHNPDLVPVLRCIALVSLFRAFASPATLQLRRELNIRRETIWRMGATISGALVAIPLALIYRNVWALVLSTLTAAAVEVLLSYYISPYRPRLEIQWDRFRDLSRFAKWIFWSNVISYCSLYADVWVAGKVLGATTFAFYQMAQQFGVQPVAQIGTHFSSVLFPTYSRLQQGGDLRKAFLRPLNLCCLALFPPTCALWFYSPAVVHFILGPKWASVAPILRVLVWTGVLAALNGITKPFLQAAGRPDIPARALVLKFIAFGAVAYPLIHYWGVLGVAWAVLLSGPVALAYQYVYIARMLKWDWDFLAAFRPGIVLSIPFIAAGVVSGLSLWPVIPAAVLGLAVLAYGIALWKQTRTVLA